MIGLLERRLDAVIYRAKFVPTVFAARQFISRGHIRKTASGGRSRLSRKGRGEVGVKGKSATGAGNGAQALADATYLTYGVDGSKLTGTSRILVLTDVPYAVQMEPHLVVEYYSR
jgi:small subunit ribosomal protein S4